MYQLKYLIKNRIAPNFFRQDTISVARNLLGKYLVSNRNNTLKIGEIIETEGYIGTEDQASHARFGQTERNKIMWGEPGCIYVYLIYGVHHLVNIITESKGFPAAVLLRSLKPIQGINIKTDGPAKICKALNLTRADTGINLLTSNEIFISDLDISPKSIVASPRIGINYAPEPWRSIPWRFTAI